MIIIRSVLEMQAFAKATRAAGKRIGLVPTMGCLHEGHLRLVDVAKETSDVIVLSIFVNPTQFGPNEDFSKYPRTFDADAEACRQRGVDVIFSPEAGEFYPKNFSTYVNEELCSRGLCGEFRPGHFRGVATVVLMLFNAVSPDVAIFGQKDAQQVAVLKKMVSDLFVPVNIVVAPIVRETDGLAMSSRNRYLSPEHRQIAPHIFATLQAAQKAVSGGEHSTECIQNLITEKLSKTPEFRVQYVAIVDAGTMSPAEKISPGNTLVAIALYLGNTRLIDNVIL